MPPTIKLRDGVNELLKERFGCSTDGEVARRVGINEGQWSRILRGINVPGHKLQALLLSSVEDLTFDDLFTIEEPVEEPSR